MISSISSDYDLSKLKIEISRLIRNKDFRAHDEKLIFLVLGGSFNPIHQGHVESFHICKDYLSRKGVHVVGGFMAVAADDWVANKLRDHGEDIETALISAAERIRLCSLSCNESSIVTVISTVEGSSNRAVRKISELIERENFGIPIEGVILCGSDAFKDSYRKHSAACIARRGFEVAPEIIASRLSRGVSTYVIEAPPSALSSTSCRSLIQKGRWAELQDLQWLHPAVLDYLRSLHQDKQSESSS